MTHARAPRLRPHQILRRARPGRPRTARCCATWRSPSRPANAWRWSVPRAPARARCCAASTATTAPTRARSASATTATGSSSRAPSRAPVLDVRRRTLGYRQPVPARHPARRRRSTSWPSRRSRLGMSARRGAPARPSSCWRVLNIPARLWALPPATFSGGEQQRVNIARSLRSSDYPDPAARRADRLARCRQPRRAWSS